MEKNDRTSFSKYYVPNVQIKDVNVLIDGKSFFDMPIKNGEEIKITGEAIYWITSTFQNKLIAIDLSQQIELENPDLKQLIKFIETPTRNEEATMFSITEKHEETTFEFS